MLPFLGIQLIYVAIAVLKIEIIHNSVDNVKELSGSYDYIVVGLGSAGSVVAERLAEDKDRRVLGLEAGIPQSAFTDIPAFWPLNPGSQYDWQFYTVPQKRMGFAYIDKRIAQPRGKAMGGTSVINFMIYNRGNRKDYDNWAQNYGCIGWDYDSVLPYLIKAENNTDPKIVSDNPTYHGTNGPVGISSPSVVDPILLDYTAVINSLGYKTTDINGPNQNGTAVCQMFIHDGLRSSTSNSYLEPNPSPNNLFISPKSYVTKILITNSTAVGVEFVKNGNTYRAKASREVIVSAGTLQSPQILMLSGIGPKDHLTKMGINVKADLPVGNNLRDHLEVFEVYSIVKNCSKVITPNPPGLTIPDLYLLYSNKSGVLSQAPFTYTFYSTKYNNDTSWPNTILWAYPAIYGTDFTPLAAKFKIQLQQQWLKYYSQFSNQCMLVFPPFVGRTTSVGTVRLNSTNPFDYPLIDQNFLSNETDLKNWIEVARFAFIVMETTEIASEIIIPGPIPGCSYCPNIPIHKCDSYLKCLIEQIGSSCYHQVGTCKMGPIDRSDVVVDTSLRVKGIKHLRVVDASIMPYIINGNTNAASIMIGEYGADIIKADNCD